MLGPWDAALFLFINGRMSCSFLDWLMVPFSQITLVWWARVFIVLAIGWCLMFRPNLRAPIVLGIIAFLLANGFSDLMKNLFQCNRPASDGMPIRFVFDFVATHKLLAYHSYGTISAHAANTAAIAAVMALHFRRRAAPWFAISFLTGFSRVYVGAHYPSQVMLGWIGGAAIGWALVVSWRQMRRAKG